jgi:hypothetical protein
MSPWLSGAPRKKNTKYSKKEQRKRRNKLRELKRLHKIALSKKNKKANNPPQPAGKPNKKSFSDLHHVFPPSHPGHQIRKIRFLHEQWHDLFVFSPESGKLATHIPEEAIYVLENYWTTADGHVRELSTKRKRAYKELFGRATTAEAIAVIRRDWCVPGWHLTIDWAVYKPPKDPDADFYYKNQTRPEQSSSPNDEPKP